MVIQVRKKAQGPNILMCTRNDGSCTWASIHPGMELHDLAHVVVETTLGFSNAFYGLVAQGYDIGDFALPREKRPKELLPSNLPVEAHQAEHIVNMLHITFREGRADMLGTLQTLLSEGKMGYPVQLTTEKWNGMIMDLRELSDQWDGLGLEGTLEFNF
ncbi:MAG: hypothetical protein AB3N16_08555 [Flavobacteriaceae bacterium]